MPGRVVNGPSGHATPGPQVMQMQERPVPAVRRSAHTNQVSEPDKLLPGLIDKDEGQAMPRGQASSYLTSTTQLNNITEAVSQHGAEERRRHMTSNFSGPYRSPGQIGKPVSTVRPQSAMAMSSPSSINNTAFAERPPSSLGVAWGSSQRNLNGNKNFNEATSGSMNQESLEARLRMLVTDSNGRQQHHTTHNGQVHYDEGELILPVHQRSHSYGDGVTLGQGYNGTQYTEDRPEDVYAVVAKRQDPALNGNATSGYVPSQPYERRGTSNAPDQRNNVRYRTQSGASYSSPDMGVRGPRGQVNMAYVPDNTAIAKDSPPKGLASASYDLRSAWQRLYGDRPNPTPSSRRPSADDITDSRKTPTVEDSLRNQNLRQQNTQQFSPHMIRPHSNSQEAVHNTNIPVGSLNRHGLPHSESKDFHYGSPPPQNHSQPVPRRESPTGQSSSNPEQASGSNNTSQLSSYSGTNRSISTFKPEVDISPSSDPAIGPASKYPDMQISGRPSNQTPVHMSHQDRNGHFYEHGRTASRKNVSSPHGSLEPISPRRQRIDSSSDIFEFNVRDNGPRPPSRKGSIFLDSEDDIGDDYQIKPLDSIFDYPEDNSENESVTPPLPPLSPSITHRGSGNITPVNMSPSLFQKTLVPAAPSRSPHSTPDLLRSPSAPGAKHRSHHHGPSGSITDNRGKAHLNPSLNMERKLHTGHDLVGKSLNRQSYANYARSRSLEDVRESGNESTMSFDVENTFLTVEPSDQSEMGTLTSQKGNSVRAQLNRLEGMYSNVMKTLEENAHSGRTRRRWSIGSSDTSSLRQHTHQSRHSRSSAHRLGSKEVRSIGKRFQRLESHVITLARSVAHLSSELRSQNTLTREIENVKREMKELKSQGPSSSFVPGRYMGGNRTITDFERNRGWVPSLTNPQRVNKLTKFFGQEPPLLKIFLERLGYEKFLKNFEEEHIGMIELPYMTEDRLQSIGIPMGPRLRILQEAQMCFRQGNFDIYFV